jgi:hypothetical protein
MRKGQIARDTVSVLENTEEAKGTLSSGRTPKRVYRGSRNIPVGNTYWHFPKDIPGS